MAVYSYGNICFESVNRKEVDICMMMQRALSKHEGGLQAYDIPACTR